MHFVQLYPQPLYTASQVRTTCRSWDEGVLTDVCLTGVLTDLCLTLYNVSGRHYGQVMYITTVSIVFCFAFQECKAAKTAVEYKQGLSKHLYQITP